MLRAMTMACGVAALLAGCGAFTSAENVFDRAVLNTNLIEPLCGPDIRSFRHGTAMLVDGKTVIKPRRDMLAEDIESIEGNLAKVEALPDDAETRDLRTTSIELHRLTLEAYRDPGYAEAAALYDREASPAEIEAAVVGVHARYCDRYQALSNRLVELGKPYAEKHGIKVNWGTP